jgi:hypothetical protein
VSFFASKQKNIEWEQNGTTWTESFMVVTQPWAPVNALMSLQIPLRVIDYPIASYFKTGHYVPCGSVVAQCCMPV